MHTFKIICHTGSRISVEGDHVNVYRQQWFKVFNGNRLVIVVFQPQLVRLDGAPSGPNEYEIETYGGKVRTVQGTHILAYAAEWLRIMNGDDAVALAYKPNYCQIKRL